MGAHSKLINMQTTYCECKEPYENDLESGDYIYSTILTTGQMYIAYNKMTAESIYLEEERCQQRVDFGELSKTCK